MTAAAPAVHRMPLWIPALGLFMAIVAGANGVLIWLSSRGHRDLVREDYYEAGLHQDRRIALAAAAGKVSLRRDGGGWLLENDAAGAPATSCRLHFYRPDDGRADREVRMDRVPSPEGREAWRGSPPALGRGHWIVTAAWERDCAVVREATLEITEP